VTSRSLRRLPLAVVLGAGLAAGLTLIVTSGSGTGPFRTEGPPHGGDYQGYAGLALIFLAFAAAVLLSWHPGPTVRRTWLARGVAFLGVLATLALGSAALYADVEAPHNWTVCERDGVYPHHIACSRGLRNTPLAQRRATELGVAAVAVAVGTLMGAMWVDGKKVGRPSDGYDSHQTRT
jgi:hypothetical protein